MLIDLSFAFVKVYNVERADVVTGQEFTILTRQESEPTPNSPVPLWFSDNDPVMTLKVNPKGDTVEATASEIGKSTVLIMDKSFQIIKKLEINVVASIEPFATDLGLTASHPLPKE